MIDDEIINQIYSTMEQAIDNQSENTMAEFLYFEIHKYIKAREDNDKQAMQRCLSGIALVLDNEQRHNKNFIVGHDALLLALYHEYFEILEELKKYTPKVEREKRIKTIREKFNNGELFSIEKVKDKYLEELMAHAPKFDNQNDEDEVEEILLQRHKDYGTPKENFTLIAKYWSIFLGIEITAEQIPLMMILMKASRGQKNPKHKDTILDIIGYAKCLQELNK